MNWINLQDAEPKKGQRVLADTSNGLDTTPDEAIQTLVWNGIGFECICCGKTKSFPITRWYPVPKLK